MGAELILAMILAGFVAGGFDESRTRASARWQQSRAEGRRGAAGRGNTRLGSLFQRARRRGPRHPLWWPYAAAWCVSAVVRGGVAAVDGAREGAAAGARRGARVGREGARAGWGYSRTWVEYRRQARADREQHERQRRQARRCRASAGRRGRDDDQDQEPPPVMVPCTSCGALITAAAADATGGRCGDCQVGREEDLNRDTAERAGDATAGDDDIPDAEVIDLDDKRTEHDKEDDAMTEIATTGQGTGEGYTDTVSTLETLAAQLKAAHETAQTLADNVTAAEVDPETIGNVGELMDALDSAAPLADQTAKGVVTRHEPIADAHAAAGGSRNVAVAGWYDDY